MGKHHPSSILQMTHIHDPYFVMSITIFYQEQVRLFFDFLAFTKAYKKTIGHRCDSASWRIIGVFTFEMEVTVVMIV